MQSTIVWSNLSWLNHIKMKYLRNIARFIPYYSLPIFRISFALRPCFLLHIKTGRPLTCISNLLVSKDCPVLMILSLCLLSRIHQHIDCLVQFTVIFSRSVRKISPFTLDHRHIPIGFVIAKIPLWKNIAIININVVFCNGWMTYINSRSCLTHWGRVMHICVSKLTIIGSDNGLSPDRRQAIIWTNAELLLIGPLRTNFSEILIEILTFSFKKMRLKASSAKRPPFCLGLNVI